MSAQPFLPYRNDARAAGCFDDARARFRRFRGGRSQAALARELGVSRSLVRRFEAGADPPLGLLLALAESGMRLDWLVFGEEPPCFAPRGRHFDKVVEFRLLHGAWETVSL